VPTQKAFVSGIFRGLFKILFPRYGRRGNKKQTSSPEARATVILPLENVFYYIRRIPLKYRAPTVLNEFSQAESLEKRVQRNLVGDLRTEKSSSESTEDSLISLLTARLKTLEQKVSLQQDVIKSQVDLLFKPCPKN
jgi:hypothetical protein